MTALEPINRSDHVIGRVGSPVELIEYGDYECPFCARAHHELTEVLRIHGNVVRYAYRHFPLVQLHRHAVLAAQAAEAAGAQGRFWPMHSVLFQNREALELDDLVTYAVTIGLDERRFLRELRAQTYLTLIQRHCLAGARSGVKATPTFFVNGLKQERWDAASLSRAVQKVRSERARRTTP